MSLAVDVERLLIADKAVRADLLTERAADGHWSGHLGSSPFATAAAVSALVVAHHRESQNVLQENCATGQQAIEQVVQFDLCELVLQSVNWLARQQNFDGGWGDCEGGRSNVAATMMVQAALRLTGIPAKHADLMVRADDYVEAEGGFSALKRHCNGDKTLLASILTNCALAGMVSWRQVPTLQLELACLPKHWRRNIQVLVPRYARPVVLAVGRAKFHHDPPKNPISRLWRKSIWRKSLALLEQLQATDDSFLASVPLTAFVVMSLASVGCQEHTTVARGVEFLLTSIRADASWSNTPNRAVSNSALALNSLLAHRERDLINASELSNSRDDVTASKSWNDATQTFDTVVELPIDISRPAFSDFSIDWLLNQQHSDSNSLTEVAAGGWASSDAPGSLPDASTTASVVTSLIRWRPYANGTHRERIERAAGRGIVWLLELQNEDGGWATFYRDNALLRRDESSIDVTSHALIALAAWQRDWKADSSPEAKRRWSFIDERTSLAIENGWTYLESRQDEDGSFIPLWFGNTHQANHANPVYGTAQVLLASSELGRLHSNLSQLAVRWLLAAQHSNGGWGPPRLPVDYSDADTDNSRTWRENDLMSKFCTVEETSLAIQALINLASTDRTVGPALSRGLKWLVAAIEQDFHRHPAIIGFSLAKLWYHERLYPLAFAAGALSRAVRNLGVETPAASQVG